MIQCATLGIPKGMKNAVSISIAFCLDLLIRNENITSEDKGPGTDNVNFMIKIFSESVALSFCFPFPKFHWILVINS